MKAGVFAEILLMLLNVFSLYLYTYIYNIIITYLNIIARVT